MNDPSSDSSKEFKLLEADLAALVPVSGNLQRDELMYRAGWEACAAAGRADATGARSVGVASNPFGRSAKNPASTWLWPLSTAALLLVSAALAALLALRDEPETRIVYVEKPADTAREPSRGVLAAKGTQQTEPTPQNGAVSEVAAARGSFSPGLRRVGDDYFSLRERVLAFGVDVLPTSVPAAPPLESESGRDMRYGSMIGRMIGS